MLRAGEEFCKCASKDLALPCQGDGSPPGREILENQLLLNASESVSGVKFNDKEAEKSLTSRKIVGKDKLCSNKGQKNSRLQINI